MTRRRPPMLASTDANQSEIVTALRRAGCSVCFLNRGGGVPDLLVGRRVRGVPMNFLLEIKTETGGLNQRQRDWHEDWNGQVCVVRTVQEALQAVGIPSALP